MNFNINHEIDHHQSGNLKIEFCSTDAPFDGVSSEIITLYACGESIALTPSELETVYKYARIMMHAKLDSEAA